MSLAGLTPGERPLLKPRAPGLVQAQRGLKIRLAPPGVQPLRRAPLEQEQRFRLARIAWAQAGRVREHSTTTPWSTR